jgi:hypothetical protein
MPDILADYREWRQQQAARVSTHSDGCHMWHKDCMIHRLADALAVEQAKRTPSESSTPGGCTRQGEGTPEPVAWAVALGDEGLVLDGIYISRAKADEVLEWRNANTEYGARLMPLFRSPTLTDAEREAIREACDEGRWYPQDYHHVRTLRGLLERTRNGTPDGRETVQ